MAINKQLITKKVLPDKRFEGWSWKISARWGEEKKVSDDCTGKAIFNSKRLSMAKATATCRLIETTFFLNCKIKEKDNDKNNIAVKGWVAGPPATGR